MRDDYDDDLPPIRGQFPKMVQVAGIIWIVFGCIIALNAAVNMVLSFGNEAPGGKAAQGGGANICAPIIGFLFGAVFIHVGQQSIRGLAKDTLGNAIGSIVFALLIGGVGAMALLGGAILGAVGGPVGGALSLVAIIIGTINLIASLGLFAAGVMALIGRSDYLAWKKAQKKPARRDLDVY
jgi:hypothetical protein